ncbi:SulP family inorganic anion transporter [Shewanella avicenniae]|uniref:SulP family inorganic anion transporter n=1 Tax=Shewanella avicenniae TaxID=2814294 RepID=A0ABX7QRP8_9GAMM|nr:SulP family inorganic anion transporter [Shewanella avicenniae]QSX34137.1 SulP family inorganic anion transporter [Shewanella avicenniae]
MLATIAQSSLFIRLCDWLPGLSQLLHYQKEWFKDDLRAALSVTAVALPVAIAYAQLTGVSAVVGLYSCVLPMLVYALFGSSRQLIVGPDAATCAVLAAVVTPLAAGDPQRHWQLIMTMTFMTGLWCLLASRFSIGVLAEFLSKPILLGLLNGVAITIIVGQFSKILGFRYQEPYLLERLLHTPQYLAQTHWLTLAIAILTLMFFILTKLMRPQWPAAMIAITVATYVSWALDLGDDGVAVVGSVSSGLPEFQSPVFDLGLTRELVMPALNLAMVSFISMMLTARSFAAKNGYDIDADAEFRALGFANIAAAASQGFAVSGADSRTAVNDANGGKTQLVSVISALVILLIILFATAPLAYIPASALGVVLVIASASLIDIKALWRLRKRDNGAFTLALITLFAVLFIGVIPGITLAVLLGLFQFLKVVMRPDDQILGINQKGILRSLGKSDKVKPIDGILIYRFNSPLTYFNAVYFKRRLLSAIATQTMPVETVIVDAVSCFSHFDLNVMAMIDELHKLLKKKNITLILAGRKRELIAWCEAAGVDISDGDIVIRPDLTMAVRMLPNYKVALSQGLAPQVRKQEDPDEVLAHSLL